jgi:hypothetical protein
MSKRYLPDIIDFAKGSAASTTGVVVGTAIAGPVGGIAGGITAAGIEVMIRKFVSKHLPKEEDIHRNLSINEEQRLKKVLSQFNTKMIQNLSVGSGKTLRQDDFFSSSINERSAAEEIFEGVLYAAEREYEEKKVKYEGNLSANIVFDSRIDRASANFLLGLAQRLSYRQLCILALLTQHERFHLRDTSYRMIERFNDMGLLAILQDIFDMYSESLLFVDGEALVSAFDIIPAQMRAVGTIGELYSLMSLEEIGQPDIQALAELLS